MRKSNVNHQEILELHSKNYTIKEICTELKLSEYIISSVLKLNGLKGVTKLDRLKDKYQDIIDLYKKTKKISVVARELNISESFVDKVLKLHNISKRVVIKSINEKDVIEEYEKVRRVKIVANKFGVSNNVILRILHSNNVRVGVMKYADDEVIQKYYEHKTIASTSRVLGISESKIIKILNKHNIKRIGFRRIEIGDVYGKLTIKEEIENKITSGNHKRRQFILECECGNLVKRNSTSLFKEKSWHCGCVVVQRKKEREEKERNRKEEYQKKLIEREEKKRNKQQIKPRKKFEVGYVKGRLTIVSISEGKYYERKIVCKCECGNIKEFKINNFYTVKSCGCLNNKGRLNPSFVHGLTSKKDMHMRKWYDRWRSMVSRCHNPNNRSYHNYGGRGIIVCDRWMEPNGRGCENYYNDIHNVLGPKPSSNHSLDRVDNNGNYEITNLRWATATEQSKNQRRCLINFIKPKVVKEKKPKVIKEKLPKVVREKRVVPILENKSNKLNKQLAEEIRMKYIPNVYGATRLSYEYGVNKTTIRDILKNRTYKQ